MRLNANGHSVRALQAVLAHLGLPVPEEERLSGTFGPGTKDMVMRVQADHQLRSTGEVDDATAAILEQSLLAILYTVRGQVRSASRAGLSGLTVRIVDKNVGADVTLATTTTSGTDGAYQVSFAADVVTGQVKASPDLQAQVLSGDIVVGSSEVRYNATLSETLNITLPASASPSLPTEYETLTRAIQLAYTGPLRNLQETADRHDITYVGNKIGWDARAVALATLADRLSASGGIAAPFYYALLRAGLPADPTTLYRIDASTVTDAWNQALAQGVIPANLTPQLPAATAAFRALAAKQMLDGTPPVGLSNLRGLLTISLGTDTKSQQRFADIYAQFSSDRARLWTEVAKAFGPAVAQRLQLDGQLAYLTLDNAPLLGRLHAAQKDNALTTTADLAARGYYDAAKWKPLVGSDVPAAIPGATVDERAANYAEILAAQVRISFPTAVVADLVRTGALALPAPDGVRATVQQFLAANQGDFLIGSQPIEQYLARKQAQLDPAALTEIKRIQRVYQITPTDQAMNALIAAKLDAAYHIVRYRQDEFVTSFQQAMGGQDVATKVYAKARQVHNAVLNLAMSYVIRRGAPAVGAAQGSMLPGPTLDFSGGGTALKGARALAAADGGGGAPPDVVAYPTLEGLFGQMDYCACEDCRSVLSPAAYLVDLLDFIDRPVNDKQNPQDVLLARRPDLQALPLTCENTNLALPYIDIVNETLEFYVANGRSLAGYTGHDTDGTVDSPELLASPQFVNGAAYDALLAEKFPPPLPFHRRLEQMRGYFDTFGSPLATVMAALRAGDAIERANPTSYGWRDILMEELRLSRAEHGLLTDSTIPLADLYGYPGGTTELGARTDLSGVKAFARRVAITYDDLVALLQTRFINPASVLIPKLQRLGVPFATLKALKDGTISDGDFDAILAAQAQPPDPAQYGGDIKAWIKDPANYARIMSLVVIANPTAPDDLCLIDELQLRHADPLQLGTPLSTIDFVRFQRFIRLWRKLGWTIPQTDMALAALYPAVDLPTGNDAADLTHLDDGFAVTLMRLGIVRQVMRRLNLQPARDLAPLLACWAPIDTSGPGSLYARMFLNPTLVARDAVFQDDGYGNYLTQAQTLGAHIDAVRSAFNLTGPELALILQDLGFDGNTALTLPNVSAIFRRGWLARALRLSVRELLLLDAMAGLDPFAPPDPPNPPIVRLLGLTASLQAAGLKPVQALYLIWNQDLSGKSAPTDASILQFASLLRADFADIESQFTVADDPDGSIARARMALVYGTDATDFFFGLIENTFSVSVPYSHGQPALEQAIDDAAPSRILYDDFAKRLSYTGVMSTTARDALVAVAGVTAAFQTAVGALYTANQAAVAPFLATYPELAGLATSSDPPATKRANLLAAILPDLKRERKAQQALAEVAAAAHVDGSFAPAILGDADILHAGLDATRPALDDLTAMETPGLSARYFWHDTATGVPDAAVDTVPSLTFGTASNPLPANPSPGAPISGIWSGFVQASASGNYNVTVSTEAGATVTLSIDGAPVTLAQAAGVWSNTSPIQLAARTLVAIQLTVAKVVNTLAVAWDTVGSGWTEIPPAALYSDTLTSRLRDAYVRFLKAATLGEKLRLDAAELAFAARRHTDPDPVLAQGWFNALSVVGGAPGPTAVSLAAAFQALLDQARLKAAFSPDDERLLDVLLDPSAALPNGDSALLTLTGWDPDSLAALLGRFGKAQSDLANVGFFARVFDAFSVVRAMAIPGAALVAAAINEPTDANVTTLQAALRARYDEAGWLSAVTPINDAVRAASRDALVAYVLRRMAEDPSTADIDTADKLFEYFLMDVQMDPCMQTSRIRHALSSVQLFVERCLMNLEPLVAPTSIDPTIWTWMRRYRVWEANRKVFLWPENWLDPELRDDQSSICKETMSELLQGDITDDAAATAMLNYLGKLADLAKLEACGIHYVEPDPNKANDVCHAIGRTAGAHRKYYYRHRQISAWSPWEQIKLDIEDNPVAPVVWNGRLLLFWLKIIKQTPVNPDALNSSSNVGALGSASLKDIKGDSKSNAQGSALVDVYAVLNVSEYYNGKWQPTRTSDVEKPTYISTFTATGSAAFDRSRLVLLFAAEDDGLRIVIGGYGLATFRLYNTHSTPVRQEDVPWTGVTPPAEYRWVDVSTPTLSTQYFGSSIFGLFVPPVHTKSVLKDTLADAQIAPLSTLVQGAWDDPFFFEDKRHVFYVTTREETVWLPDHDDYGFGQVATANIDTSNLVAIQTYQPIPKGDPVETAQQGGVVDPVALGRFVSQDANIRVALATTRGVQVDTQTIGASGAVSTQALVSKQLG
jgi:hypothetical protein